VSVEGGSWWTLGADVAMGPGGTDRCFGGVCQKGGLTWAGGSGLWLRSGVATYGAGLIAAFVLVILAAALAAKRSGRLAAGSAAVACVTALAPAATFVATRPALGPAPSGYGLWLFGAGVALGLVAARLVLAEKPAPAPASPKEEP